MQQIQAQADAAELSVLTALFSGNSTGGVVSFEYGEVSAVALGNETAAVTAGGAEVEVPAAVAKLLPAGVALVLTALNSTGNSGGDDGSVPIAGATSQDDEGEQLEVRGSLRISVVGPDGEPVKISGLAEPIALTFPMNLSEGMQCAYWDEDGSAWAQDGLQLASQDVGDKMVCLTTHLTLFGAIWRGFRQSFECTQFTLFHPDSLAQLRSGDWLLRPSSMSFFVMLLILLATALFSLAVDVRRRWRSHWRDELFLIPVGQPDSSSEDEQEPPVKRGPFMAFVCAVLTGIMCCGHGAEAASAMRDALDDVMSSYFEWFGQVRDWVEENLDNLRGSLAFFFSSRARTMTIGDFVLIGVSKLLVASLPETAQVQASASLKMSGQCVTTFLENEDIADIQGRAMLAMDASLAEAAFAYAEKKAVRNSCNSHNSDGEPRRASITHAMQFLRRRSLGSNYEVEDDCDVNRDGGQEKASRRASVSSALEFLRRRSIGSDLEVVSIGFDEPPERFQDRWPTPASSRRLSLLCEALGEDSTSASMLDSAALAPEAIAISVNDPCAVAGTAAAAAEATRQRQPSTTGGLRQRRLSGTGSQLGRCRPSCSSLNTLVLDSVLPAAVSPPLEEAPPLMHETGKKQDRLKKAKVARKAGSGQPAAKNVPPLLCHTKSMTDVERESCVTERCAEVKGAVQKAFMQAGRARDLPRHIARAYLVRNPLGEIFVTDLFVTSFMRAFLWCLHMIATLALAAAFFVSSGNVGKKNQACSASDTSGFMETLGAQLGRCVAIAIGSTFISGRPIAFLESLQTRNFVKVPYEESPEAKRQLAAWRMQDRMVLVLGLVYLAAATFFVLLFLANLSFSDGSSYMLASAIAVAQELIAVPLLLAIFRPSMVAMSLGILCRAKGLSKQEVLSDKYEELMATSDDANEADTEERQAEQGDADAGAVEAGGAKRCWSASEHDPDLKAAGPRPAVPECEARGGTPVGPSHQVSEAGQIVESKA